MLLATSLAGNQRWFPGERRPRAALRLFCFPFAGGSAQKYLSWNRGLSPEIDAIPVELPGHGARRDEPVLRRWPELVRAASSAIVALLDRPFAFFGYSMGAKLALELAAYFRRIRGVEPTLFFVAASRAPGCPPLKPPTFNLPRAQFFAEVAALGGVSPALLEAPELWDLNEEILRADFELSETHVLGGRDPLTCPIFAFAGSLDSCAPAADVARWRAHTAGPFSLETYSGEGHFFLDSRRNELLAAIQTRC